MNHPESYRGQQVVVLGLAKSGVQVAKVLDRAGAKVTVNDKKRGTVSRSIRIGGFGNFCCMRGHPDDLIHEGVKLVVKTRASLIRHHQYSRLFPSELRL